MRTLGRLTLLPSVLALLIAGSTQPVTAQTPASSAWFGVKAPPPFEPHTSPVILGEDYGPRPALIPPGEERFPELTGASIRRDVARIVGFSRESRESREVGDGLLWGRITGLPSGEATMDWAAERMEAAAVPRVERQWFDQDGGASLWLPLSWELRVLGDEAFGSGTQDMVLESAIAANEAPMGREGLTAPLVFVGTARAAELDRIDVRGKVAVQHITPKGHLFLERGPARAKAQELIRRGAVGVVNLVDQAGNMRMRDISGCGGPCFNIGGQDGRWLEEVMDAAAEAGVADRLRVRMRLRDERRSGMRASNVLGIVPGDSDENVIINAHVDGWFDGANDNADGFAIMLALATHFARRENRPARTLVFVASAGHHTAGLSGPARLVELNPDLIEHNVLVINLEHVAARQINPARTDTDGLRDLIADSGEGFLMNGVSNRSPALEEIIRQGGIRYGLNFVSQASTYHAGDNPRVDSPIFQLIQGNPLYHTSGDVLETISTPGLERVARFVAFFVKEVNELPREWFYPLR
jgi:hypothetical protein